MGDKWFKSWVTIHSNLDISVQYSAPHGEHGLTAGCGLPTRNQYKAQGLLREWGIEPVYNRWIDEEK